MGGVTLDSRLLTPPHNLPRLRRPSDFCEVIFFLAVEKESFLTRNSLNGKRGQCRSCPCGIMLRRFRSFDCSACWCLWSRLSSVWPRGFSNSRLQEDKKKAYGYGKAQRGTFDSSSWGKTHLSRALKCHFSGPTGISLWLSPDLANSVCVLNAESILPCSAPCSFLGQDTPSLTGRSTSASVPMAAPNDIKLSSSCDEECFAPVLSVKWHAAHYL